MSCVRNLKRYCENQEKQERWTGKDAVKRHQTLTWLLGWRTEVILDVGVCTKKHESKVKKGNLIKKNNVQE